MMLSSANWQCVGDQTFELGESPFWHPLEQMLYWVDIAGKKILRTDVSLGLIESWDMPSEPGCIAPAASGGLVIALRHGVFRARRFGAALEPIATLAYDPALMRANDGKCDALGRFWIGTLDETKTAHNAALYSLDCRSAGSALIECKVADASTANALAWSPDGRTVYWADTPSHTIHAWDFEPDSNAMSARRVFHQFEPKPAHWQFHASASASDYQGRPDGAAVDQQGHYFVAMYEGRRLCQFAPDGRLLAQWATPAQCPTMPCFGGADLRTLFVTSARHGRSAAELAALPLSGCVFSMRMAVPGLPVNFFAD